MQIPFAFRNLAAWRDIPQDMAPASASPPPPPDRSEIGQGGRCDADGQGEQCEGLEREGEGQACETYGPLDFERHVKDDDRVLILYTHRKREDA
jgi:hypothetical protein